MPHHSPRPGIRAAARLVDQSKQVEAVSMGAQLSHQRHIFLVAEVRSDKYGDGVLRRCGLGRRLHGQGGDCGRVRQRHEPVNDVATSEQKWARHRQRAPGRVGRPTEPGARLAVGGIEVENDLRIRELYVPLGFVGMPAALDRAVRAQPQPRSDHGAVAALESERATTKQRRYEIQIQDAISHDQSSRRCGRRVQRNSSGRS